MRLRRRLALIGALFLVVFSAGTTAFMLVEGWPFLDALYMTTITLSTVGFQKVHPLGTGGRLVAIALILGGTGSLAYGLSVVTEQDLTRLKHLERFGPTPVIEGDATDGGVLTRFRIEVARGLITTLPSDKDNLFVILTARELNPGLRIVSRAIQDDSHPKLRKAGADAVVSANQIGGLRLVSEMVRPQVVSFLDSMLRDPHRVLRVEEAEVVPGSPVVGKTLGELDLILIVCAGQAQIDALREVLAEG